MQQPVGHDQRAYSTGMRAATHIYSKIRKLQLAVKNLVCKGVDFYVQNALKFTYTTTTTPV